MKQTVEEAAKQWDETNFGKITPNTKIELTEEKHSQFLTDAFKAGATWAIDLGTIWFTVSENYPEQRKRVLCCTTSGYLAMGYLEGEVWMYDARSISFEYFGYNIAHWAYITSPE